MLGASQVFFNEYCLIKEYIYGAVNIALLKGGIQLKEYIEERVLELANYIIDKKTTVRYAAKKFGISKSTVHKDVTKWNGITNT